MALDPSIALQAKLPQFDNPLNQLAQFSTIQNAQNQNQLAQYGLAKAKRDDEDTTSVRNLLTGAGGDLEAGKNALYKGGFYKQAMELGKTQLEQQKSQSEIDKNKATAGKNMADVEKTNFETFKAKKDYVVQNLTGVLTQRVITDASIAQIAKGFMDNGINDPLHVMQMVASLPPEADQAGRRAAITSMLMGNMKADDQMRYSAPDANTAANNRQSGANTAATVAGARENNIRTTNATLEGQNKPHFDSERGVLVDPRNSVATPVVGADGKPLGNKDKAPPAEYAKQSEAYLNMGDALTSYKTKLTNFGAMSYLSPSDRSDLGTSYQNVLLQAKELYRLGVLNGPDEGILKTIITNPLEWKNGALPKEAMLKQAEQLEGIVTNSSKNLAKVYGREPMPLNSAVKAAQSGTEGMTNKSKSGKPIVFRNGQWEYQ
jgi:hypothetical protein